MHYIRGV